MSKDKPFLDLFLEWTQEGKSPTSYWEASALSALAACADRTIWYNNGVDPLYPNLFTVLVGPPGTAKTTTIRKAKSIIKHIDGIYLVPDEITMQQLYVRMETDGRKKYTDQQGTEIEYTSCNAFIPEWSSFIGEQDTEFLKRLNRMYDCDDFEYETKHQDCNYMPKTYLNMIGDIQPEIIPDVLPPAAIGTGFSSRVIFVVEHHKRPGYHGRPDFDSRLEHKLAQIAYEIYRKQGEMRLSTEANKIYMEWYDSEEYSERLKGLSRFTAYVDRKPQHVLKIAMLMSLSRTHGKSLMIEVEDYQRALAWLNKIETNMPDAFIAFGQSVYARVTWRIGAFIQIEKETSIDKILSIFWSDVSLSELQKILASLEAQGKITIEKKLAYTVVRWRE